MTINVQHSVNVILYIRVSSKEQGKSGIGMASQEAEMLKYAEAQGYNVLDIKREIISGKYALDRRPVLKAALEKTVKNDCHVMVARLDRMSRSSEFIGSITKADCKYKWFSMEDGMHCDAMVLQIKAAVGESFRNRNIQRAKESSAVKRARGIPMGMNLPQVAAHKERAGKLATKAIVKEADSFAEFMRPTISMLRREGMNYSQIAEYLNKHGYKTQRNGAWYSKTVLNVVDRWR